MPQKETERRLNILTMPFWKEYELVDSGNGRKLERYGKYLLSRPEAEAIWKPALPQKAWQDADAVFKSAPEKNGGHWQFNRQIPKQWIVSYKGLKLWAKLSASRHVGVFPEQAVQWDWIDRQIKSTKRPMNVLNLFGYTGLATLAAARAGARVTHIDASKKVVGWARENQQLSNLSNLPIRWLIDDARKFVLREGRRGVKYDGLILDPPKFGRGPKGEVWEFFKLIAELLDACGEIISPNPQFVAITAYAVKASPLSLETALQEILKGKRGATKCGEITIKEKSAGRLLSTAIYARWSASDRSR